MDRTLTCIGRRPKGPTGALVVMRANHACPNGPAGVAIVPRELSGEIPIGSQRYPKGFNLLVKSDKTGRTADRRSTIGIFVKRHRTRKGMVKMTVLVFARVVVPATVLNWRVGSKHKVNATVPDSTDVYLASVSSYVRARPGSETRP